MKCERLDEKEKLKFGSYIRKLLNDCFVMKSINEEAYMYYLKYQDAFNEYLNIIGYELVINMDYQVVTIRQMSDESMTYSLRKTISRVNTAILAIFMNMYYEAITKTGEDKDEVFVELRDVFVKADEWNIFGKDGYTAKKWEDSINELKKMNLVDVCNGNDYKNGDVMIHLLPSLSLALNPEAFKNTAEEIKGEYLEDEFDE